MVLINFAQFKACLFVTDSYFHPSLTFEGTWSGAPDGNFWWAHNFKTASENCNIELFTEITNSALY